MKAAASDTIMTVLPSLWFPRAVPPLPRSVPVKQCFEPRCSSPVTVLNQPHAGAP